MPTPISLLVSHLADSERAIPELTVEVVSVTVAGHWSQNLVSFVQRWQYEVCRASHKAESQGGQGQYRVISQGKKKFAGINAVTRSQQMVRMLAMLWGSVRTVKALLWSPLENSYRPWLKSCLDNIFNHAVSKYLTCAAWDRVSGFVVKAYLP